MTSPFPGMDPFLEGHLWPDFHQELSSAIKGLLAPLIGPKYVARLSLYTVADQSPEDDIGIMYPDVEVLLRQGEVAEPVLAVGKYAITEMPTTPVTVSLDLAQAPEVRVPVIEIRDRKSNRLVTAIEILSPVNKRGEGLETYRRKRSKLQNAGVHLLEIDLLRRGERPIRHPHLPVSHYMASLTRAGKPSAQIWAFNLNDTLPVLPVPLDPPDPDVPLPLRRALDEIYERSLYNLSINYMEPPPPPAMSEAESEWMRKVLKNGE